MVSAFGLLWRSGKPVILAALLFVLLVAGGLLASDGLTRDEAATLRSLQRVDDLPFYTMRYVGPYDRGVPAGSLPAGPRGAWGCSLFYAQGGKDGPLFGRNFDWDAHPALLLFTDPPDGYGAVAMVDISYLGYGANDLARLDTLEGRRGLLRAPLLPFDGLNERGLAIGMAAIPASDAPNDPSRPTVGSLQMMRLILDRAETTEQAISLFSRYNVDFTGGPTVHYLIADRRGDSALVELGGGHVNVQRGNGPWQAATNFRQDETPREAWRDDYRYHHLATSLADAAGKIDAVTAMRLLDEVHQASTRWSIVYGMTSGQVRVATIARYGQVHGFNLDTAGQ